jgi:hypothetical protein
VIVVEMVGARYFLHFMFMKPDGVQAVVGHHLLEQLLRKRSISPDAATHHSLPTLSGAQWVDA